MWVFKLSITKTHLLGVWIADFQQAAHFLGKVCGGALFGHGDVAAPLGS